ncbi:MAG: hypothetical protein ACRD1K_06185 [Acidimicrobiales bacterium]
MAVGLLASDRRPPAVFAAAAGRVGGLDGILRPRWRQSPTRLARLALVVS